MPETVTAAPTIVNKMSETICLKNFFGFKDGQKLPEFNQELKALDPKEKTELATLAKAELIRMGKYKAEDFAF